MTPSRTPRTLVLTHVAAPTTHPHSATLPLCHFALELDASRLDPLFVETRTACDVLSIPITIQITLITYKNIQKIFLFHLIENLDCFLSLTMKSISKSNR
ncbi:hypothetical protein JHK87_052845 [Glycine soja]|nr:hypothetical protein JHK87_052845 [Glycine soja]